MFTKNHINAFVYCFSYRLLSWQTILKTSLDTLWKFNKTFYWHSRKSFQKIFFKSKLFGLLAEKCKWPHSPNWSPLAVDAVAEKNGKSSDEQKSIWTEGGKKTVSECLGIHHFIFILLILVAALYFSRAKTACQSMKMPATTRITCS